MKSALHKDRDKPRYTFLSQSEMLNPLSNQVKVFIISLRML